MTSNVPCHTSTVTMPGSSASVRPASSFSPSAAWMPATTWTMGAITPAVSQVGLDPGGGISSSTQRRQGETWGRTARARP